MVHSILSIVAAIALTGGPTSPPIDGPSDAPLGKLIVLRVQVPDAVKFRWVLANTPADDNHQECGDRLIFATGIPGEYTFFMSAIVQTPGTDPDLVVAKHTVRVGGSTPGIPPPPPITPTTPPVTPPVTPSVASLAEASARRVMDPVTARRLAGLYETYAPGAKVSESVQVAIAGFDVLTAALLRATNVYLAWRPFLQDMDAICDAQTTTSGLASTYEAIAAGLKKAGE